MNNLLLNNMQVVLPDGSRESASVLVEGDKISSIVEAGVEVKADTKIDLTGTQTVSGIHRCPQSWLSGDRHYGRPARYAR